MIRAALAILGTLALLLLSDRLSFALVDSNPSFREFLMSPWVATLALVAGGIVIAFCALGVVGALIAWRRK